RPGRRVPDNLQKVAETNVVGRSLPPFSAASTTPGNQLESKPERAEEATGSPVSIAIDSGKEPLASPPDKPSPPVATSQTFKRRQRVSDHDLAKDLALAPEFTQGSLPPGSLQQVTSAFKLKRYRPDEMPDFGGLPLRMGLDCQLGKEAADNLQA